MKEKETPENEVNSLEKKDQNGKPENEETTDINPIDENPDETGSTDVDSKEKQGDFTFTLYRKEYTTNQSEMMLIFFEEVLKRHQDYVASLPDYAGMNCASATDYTDKKNRTKDMMSYFRVCRYMKFDNSQGICIGTAYGINDKLKKMALLLAICGEDASVFSSDQATLPPVKSPVKKTKTVDLLQAILNSLFMVIALHLINLK